MDLFQMHIMHYLDQVLDANQFLGTPGRIFWSLGGQIWVSSDLLLPLLWSGGKGALSGGFLWLGTRTWRWAGQCTLVKELVQSPGRPPCTPLVPWPFWPEPIARRLSAHLSGWIGQHPENGKMYKVNDKCRFVYYVQIYCCIGRCPDLNFFF